MNEVAVKLLELMQIKCGQVEFSKVEVAAVDRKKCREAGCLRCSRGETFHGGCRVLSNRKWLSPSMCVSASLERSYGLLCPIQKQFYLLSCHRRRATGYLLNANISQECTIQRYRAAKTCVHKARRPMYLDDVQCVTKPCQSALNVSDEWLVVPISDSMEHTVWNKVYFVARSFKLHRVKHKKHIHFEMFVWKH